MLSLFYFEGLSVLQTSAVLQYTQVRLQGLHDRAMQSSGLTSLLLLSRKDVTEIDTEVSVSPILPFSCAGEPNVRSM